MNTAHVDLCSSAEWADAVRRWIVPWALDGVQLGDDVLEIGPGPGHTTEVLRERATRLTAVEIDSDLAAALRDRLPTEVRVINADATATGLPPESFDTAVSLTMLHHVPGDGAQDAVFAEMRRLLRAGGLFVGSDNLDGEEFRALHEGDTCVPVAPSTLAERLRRAGFDRVEVDTNEYAVRFRAWVV